MTTRQEIESIIRSGEKMSAADIAERCGVSRQRVHQIMRKEGWKAPIDGRKGASKRALARGGAMTSPLMTGGIPSNVSTTIGGQISEMLVAADLLARGYKPFQPVARASLFDLIAVNPCTGQVLTIDAKTGKRNGGGLIFQKNVGFKMRHCAAEPDHYAVVCRGEPVTYVPDIPPVLSAMTASLLKKES